MNQPISTEQRITVEARQAAAKWNDINAACPYPWGSGAALIFKREFYAEQQRLVAQSMAAADPPEPFCGCAHELTAHELESMRCQECGKAVVL